MSTRETNLSKQDAYRLIMNSLIKQGVHVRRSDEPSRIVAEVGDWKRSLLTRPWADITVDISEADDRSHIKFTFDFRKMYSSVLALFIVVYLVVVSIGVFATGLSHWPFQPLGTALTLFLLLFVPFAFIAQVTRETKEKFMTEVDRFLPSV
jgi:hypothetical protein